MRQWDNETVSLTDSADCRHILKATEELQEKNIWVQENESQCVCVCACVWVCVIAVVEATGPMERQVSACHICCNSIKSPVSVLSSEVNCIYSAQYHKSVQHKTSYLGCIEPNPWTRRSLHHLIRRQSEWQRGESDSECELTSRGSSYHSKVSFEWFQLAGSLTNSVLHLSLPFCIISAF